MDINTLATVAIDCIDSTAAICSYLPEITKVPKDKLEAEIVLQHIAAIIRREAGAIDSDDEIDHGQAINQAVLNLSFRAYFHLLHQYDLEDRHYARVASGELLTHRNAHVFQMLYSMLLADHWKRLNPQHLSEQCLQSLSNAVEANSNSILAILKALNLLTRKFPTLNIELSLEHIYHCLQQSGQSGIRDEVLLLFNHSCKQSAERAFAYFQLIASFWPWTNRNKFYLLSGILNSHRLSDLLASGDYSPSDFFAGIRLSLNYKCLLASSQYLIRSLSNQESEELLELAAEILTRGTLKEIQNFYSQWFGRIGAAQKDSLFLLLQQKPEISRFLEDSNSSVDSTENFRLILIFSMFSRQIFLVSKLHFFKISTELITNCSHYEIEAQLLIFKFIVDNFGNFAIEDCLDFIMSFVRQHKSVENARFRNSILGKVPTIINYVAKTFSKLHVLGSTLEGSIKSFFQQLQDIIAADVQSELYQPKIFSLKLLEILLKSLYAQSLAKNAKNCILTQNQNLGQFLIQQNVFNEQKMSDQLLSLLNDRAFDDASDLIVSLLKQLHFGNSAASLKLCMVCCQSCDIDECNLSSLYAKVSMQALIGQEAEALKLFEYAFNALNEHLIPFQSDPLHTCRTRSNFFGYLNTINEVVSFNPSLLTARFQTLLSLLKNILNIVLDFLFLANLKRKDDDAATTLASFQDIDESLQLLVQESSARSGNDEESRKFLLMTFWLTLKACCDLSTSMGCIVAPTSELCEEDLAALAQSLEINVAVLTRCRHKGAIEAAGASIGKLTKCITSQLQPDTKGYNLLQNCLQLLFDDVKQVSTTRRGAGFSIMFLHIVKNEEQRAQRPLLKRAVQDILARLQGANTEVSSSINYDRLEALTLHYLCVLVKDCELREAMSKYYNEIMMAAIMLIDNAEWTVCNAALQLTGALIPKIVGQKQATEFDEALDWEPTEMTYSEIARKLPRTCEYILNYCSTKSAQSTSTRSLILFLGFLAKVEHLRKSDDDVEECTLILSFRELMWLLLRHNCEKVRKLAATCFVRAHEFRSDLPNSLLEISRLLYRITNENFFQGLVVTLIEGVRKMHHESKHTLSSESYDNFMWQLQRNLSDNFKGGDAFKLYTLCQLLDLLESVGFDKSTPVVSKLVELNTRAIGNGDVGWDVWQQKVEQILN